MHWPVCATVRFCTIQHPIYISCTSNKPLINCEYKCCLNARLQCLPESHAGCYWKTSIPHTISKPNHACWFTAYLRNESPSTKHSFTVFFRLFLDFLPVSLACFAVKHCVFPADLACTYTDSKSIRPNGPIVIAKPAG